MPELSADLPLAVLRQEIQHAFLTHEDGCVTELEELLAQRVEEGVERASLVVHPDLGRAGGVEFWLMVDGEGRPVLSHDDTIYAGGAFKLFHHLRVPTFDVAARSEPDVAELVAEWAADFFAECWFKAGGWKHPLPVCMRVKGSEDEVPLTRVARA